MGVGEEHSPVVQWLGLGAFRAIPQLQYLVRELIANKWHGMEENKKKTWSSIMYYRSLNREINDSDPTFSEFTAKVGREPHKYIQYKVRKS